MGHSFIYRESAKTVNDSSLTGLQQQFPYRQDG
jgi:hypothetical protein